MKAIDACPKAFVICWKEWETQSDWEKL